MRALQLQTDRRSLRRPGTVKAASFQKVIDALTGKGRELEQTATQVQGPNRLESTGSSQPTGPNTLSVQVVESVSKVPRAVWDSLVRGQAETNPFLLWDFLHALEESKSVDKTTGWLPQHLLVKDEQGQLVGACPLYLKGHSYGEYVFDSSWANYASLLGQRYYPKLQSCVPFTPVTGHRLLVSTALPASRRAAVTQALGKALIAVADAMDVSSLHLTFLTAEEWAALAPLGFQQRCGIQFHWDNRDYTSFEEFLGDLKQSKRKSIRQERKGVASQGLQVERLSGDSVRNNAALWDRFYAFYEDTVDKKWGTAYLTREFFHRLGEAMADDVVLVVAKDTSLAKYVSGEGSADVVAAALNLAGSHALFGRNWGCAPGREYKYLHFELCYYQALEEAIARKLPRVEAGAQGEHKLQRGYLPAFTYSSHYIRDPQLSYAVSRFLARERAQIEYTMQALSLEASPYKQDTTMAALTSRMVSHITLSSSSSSVDASVDMASSSPSTQQPQQEKQQDEA